MNISRKRLAEIVAEEVRRRLRELVEADDDPEGRPRRKPGVASADQDDVPDSGEAGAPNDTVGSPEVGAPEGGSGPDADSDGPAVDGDSPDPEAIDREGEAGEDPSGAVADEVSGKTVQGLSIEPESKILPGAKEVVVTFNETTDSLRILCTATEVKFFWKGQLYDIP